MPLAPGPGVRVDQNALARLHEQDLACGIRDNRRQMQKCAPSFTGACPRF